MRFPKYVVVLGSMVTALTNNAVNAEWLKQSRDVMGTRVSVEIAHRNASHAQNCAERVFADMQRIDALMSSYRSDSAISRINRLAASQPVQINNELFRLIEQSIHYSKISDGAFDITFASIGYRYDFRNRVQPDAATVQAVLPTINYQNLRLEDQSIRFAAAGMRIDLGGIAKGHAVDNAISILKQCGIQQALVSAGGDSRILGDRDGRPWMIGIRHPRKAEALALSIPLSDSAISTSGDYERYFLSNNERIHHIINPTTGRSATASWSASVIGVDATSTDALSTTLFVLGAQKGMALIETLPDMDAIIIDANGVVHYSSGLVDPAKPG